MIVPVVVLAVAAGLLLTRRAGNSVWNSLGIALAVVVVVTGLMALAFFIILVIAFNNFGSNK